VCVICIHTDIGHSQLISYNALKKAGESLISRYISHTSTHKHTLFLSLYLSLSHTLSVSFSLPRHSSSAFDDAFASRRCRRVVVWCADVFLLQLLLQIDNAPIRFLNVGGHVAVYLYM